MKVLLPSYRSIDWMVKAYVKAHNLYWGDPVVLIAEDDYSDGAFEFAHPPPDVAPLTKGEYHPSTFSSVLIWYMRQIEDELVVITMADHLPYRPIDRERFDDLQEYMLLHPEIVRGQVGDDGGLCRGTMTDVFKSIKIWEGNFLISSLTPALWRRTLLLEMLKPNVEPWTIEADGRTFIPSKGWRSVAPQPGIICYVNALRGRDNTNIVITEGLYKEIGGMLRVQPKGFAPERPFNDG